MLSSLKVRKTRTCLKCNKEFTSLSPANRICSQCKVEMNYYGRPDSNTISAYYEPHRVCLESTILE